MTNRKKRSNRFTGLHNPLYNEVTPLSFDNQNEIDVLKLTEDQATERFISQWMKRIDPFDRYKKKLLGQEESPGRTVNMIKNMYRRYVIHQGWTESKYAMVVDSILTSRDPMIPDMIEKHGKMYDEERLEIQQIARRASKRKGRI